MPRPRIAEIVFDDYNTPHATRHGVTVQERCALLTGEVTVRSNRRSKTADYIATGETEYGGRITVAFTYDDGRTLPARSLHGGTDGHGQGATAEC